MAKQSILLIDPHQRSLSVMEPSLRKFGYEVQCAMGRPQAESYIQLSIPDLIVTEVALQGRGSQDQDGISLCKEFKADPKLAEVPIIFVSDQEEARASCLNAGAETFLVKPVYMGELKTVIEAALKRRQRVSLEHASGDRFFGRLEEMGLLDLLQVIDVSRRSGELLIEHRGQKGSLSFKDGQLLDAQLGKLSGPDAIYRLLTWEFGQYEFDFNAPERPRRIELSIAEVKEEGLKRLDQWNQMCGQLPSLDTVLRVDRAAVSDRGEPLSPEMNTVLRLFDGRRTMQEVIDQTGLPDLTGLNALTLLYFEGLVNEVRERSMPQDEVGFIESSSTPSPGEQIAKIKTKSEPLPPALDDAPPPPPPPPIDADEPPALDMPPPPSAVDVDDDDGQELLQDLYASIAGPVDLSPPPLPEPESVELPESAEISSFSAFGGDEYEFEDGEEDFFSALNEADEEPIVEVEAQDASTKLTLILLTVVAGLVIAWFMRDKTPKLEITKSTSQLAVWYTDRIANRVPQFVADIPVDWKIEREVTEESNSVIAEVANSGEPLKERKMKGSEKRRFQQLSKEALELYKEGGEENFKRAGRLADQALDLNPGNPHALMLSGTLHIETGDNKTAISRLEQLIKINAKYSDTQINRRYEEGALYVLLGSAYQGLNKKERALELYEQYLREYPEGNQARDVRNLIGYLR
jgi:DNA-binding response OmpR family regulator